MERGFNGIHDVHRIRLSAAWQMQLLGDPSPSKRFRLPQVETSKGSVTLRRSFNRPTGLTPEQDVLLEIESIEADRYSIELNGNVLSSGSHGKSIELSLAGRLEAANQIVLRLEGESCRVDGEVFLKIIE